MDPSSWPTWTRQTFLLLAWYLVGTSVAQHDPIKDFCRRWGHQSAVVDRRLYIDGGLVNYKPFTSSSQNLTNTFLAYNDLDSVTDGMPPLYANISKNDTIPSVNGGILWEDSVNKRLYLYGGEYYDTSPAAFNLYSYDILYDEWVSFGPPTGAGTINAVSYGAGVSIPSRGEAYYYGGWLSNASVPDWTGPPRATNRLIKYTMDSNSWSNLTGPDDVRRAEGSMVFIPIGDAGMLVYFGGSKDLYGNGTLTPQPLDEIFLFDVANGKWYTQQTSGRTPEIRRRFCGGATWAQDQSSYNIYIYGGAGFPPETTGYDDIYILTIPSFQWIRGPYPPGSNVTGAFPKSMMSCNVIDNAQMLVIGGTYSNDTTYMCDADSVWGTHNMDLGEENPDNAIWALYKPNLTTYAVPTDILTAVGGRNSGGAVKTKPISGFDAPDLSVLMTRTALPATRKPTRQVSFTTTTKSTSTPTSKPDDDSPSLSTGAIAGIAVGGSIALILALLGCCFFIRRRRKYYSSQHTAATPVSFNGPAMSTTPNHHHQHQHHGSMSQGPVHSGLNSTQAVSPMTAAPSYNAHQWVQPVGPPAELASEGELHSGQRSMSPMSGKFEIGPGGPQLSG
ncbi:hypothetical protein B0J13DRAFT_646745 [Dactylonectria estremocensis]|uniref:Attractin/MKLN-like beta-propeller domain-containing protein n=1 Tax=Dactylonectria estremocensis TaxID=1079267 RepID=A0A9P9IMQ9_9HYPO|nr:hypothetical protein B0J13DRAFT_646745 [Dactylonectria estremocensis]